MFICLSVCLFVYLFIDLFVFCFSNGKIPTGSFPQNFVKIQLDLAEILGIRKLDWKMFICLLFVCLFGCFCLHHILVPTGRLSESFVKI